MQQLILEKAKALFFSYGLKSVSMDDIAKNAGVSKKTIYKDFEDKTQLVQSLAHDLLHSHNEAFVKTAAGSRDAIDEVLSFANEPFDTLAVISPSFFYELEKYFPQVWQLFIDYKRQVLVPSIIQNLERGIGSELYRDDLIINVMADLRVQQIATALNPKEITRNYHGQKLMLLMPEFYLRGIVTHKGEKLINKYLNVNNEKDR